jgi:hypothetical protein
MAVPGAPGCFPFPSPAFNLLVNKGYYTYSYYIQGILFQGTAKVPARRLIKLGEQYRHWPASGLNRLEKHRAKNPFRIHCSVVCTLHDLPVRLAGPRAR